MRLVETGPGGVLRDWCFRQGDLWGEASPQVGSRLGVQPVGGAAGTVTGCRLCVPQSTCDRSWLRRCAVPGTQSHLTPPPQTIFQRKKVSEASISQVSRLVMADGDSHLSSCAAWCPCQGPGHPAPAPAASCLSGARSCQRPLSQPLSP